MATSDKKFYWLKLKQEFMNGEIVDFLMSQKNGANYVVLYQMLCLKTINTQGELATSIGEVLIPFDVEKIQRECKWFDLDTIRIALTLYQKLGLLFEQSNGIIKISNFEEMVGNETYWARQKRIERQNNSENEKIGQPLDNVQQNVQNTLISNISTSISNSTNNTNIDNIEKEYKQERESLQNDKVGDNSQTATLNHSHFKEEKNKVSGQAIDGYFDKVWELYPKRVGKVQARKTFEHKLRSLDEETCLQKARRIYSMLKKQISLWTNEFDGQGRKIEYIPHLSTWLNDNVEDSPYFKRGAK